MDKDQPIHSLEDSFNEYLNLSRVNPDRQQTYVREMFQPPTVGRQPATNIRQEQPKLNAGYQWQNGGQPQQIPSRTGPMYQQSQPQMMGYMMQQMMSNPVMMTNMMMAQFQMMQQQMLSSRLPPQDPITQGKNNFSQPITQQRKQFQTFQSNDPLTITQVLPQSTVLQNFQPKNPTPKISVRGNYNAYNNQSQSSVQTTKLTSSIPASHDYKLKNVPTDELRQRQGSGQNFKLDENIDSHTTKPQIMQPASVKNSAKKAHPLSIQQPVNNPVKETTHNKQSAHVRKIHNFDDIPIRPMKSQPVDMNDFANPQPPAEIPPRKKVVPFDEVPVGKKSFPAFNQFNDEVPAASQPPTYQQIKVPKVTRASQRQKSNPYNEFEDRPIKVTNMNFEDLIQQKVGKNLPAEEPVESEGRQPNEPRVSNFLKKGSRQFLSSAKYKASTGHSQTKEDNTEARPPPKKISKAAVNTSIRDNQYQSKTQTLNKPKPPQRSKPDRQPQQKSPVHKKLIDTEERSLQRSEPRKQKFNKPEQPKSRKPFNLFEDQPSDEGQECIEIAAGVKIQKWQYNKLKQQWTLESESVKIEEERLQRLRFKYEEMLKILEHEKQQNAEKLQQQRDEFQQFKKQEMRHIKNQKRVAERQKQAVCSTTNKKEKQELEIAKKQWEKEREDIKKKQNRSRIIIEKQKREIQELKRQLMSASQTVEIDSRLKHTKTSEPTEVSVERDRERDRDIRDTKKPVTSKRPALQEDRSESKDQISKHHKSILNTEGKFSQQKQESRHGHQSKFETNKHKQHEKSKSQMSESSFPASNTSNISKHMPDYEDLKTDRAKLHPSQNASAIGNVPVVKVLSKNTPATLQQRHKTPSYDEDRPIHSKTVKPGWSSSLQHQRPSQNEKSSASHVSSDEDISFEQYHENMTLSDLNHAKLSIRMVTEDMIENLLHYYANDEYQRYQQLTKSRNRKIKDEVDSGDGKVTRTYTDGIKQTVFQTGVRKEVMPSGYTIIYFKNRDIKQKLSDGTTLYFFSEKQVDQITLLNKVNIFRFENNQVEFHFPDGIIQIRHADGTIKIQNKQ